MGGGGWWGGGGYVLPSINFFTFRQSSLAVVYCLKRRKWYHRTIGMFYKYSINRRIFFKVVLQGLKCGGNTESWMWTLKGLFQYWGRRIFSFPILPTNLIRPTNHGQRIYLGEIPCDTVPLRILLKWGVSLWRESKLHPWSVSSLICHPGVLFRQLGGGPGHLAVQCTRCSYIPVLSTSETSFSGTVN